MKLHRVWVTEQGVAKRAVEQDPKAVCGVARGDLAGDPTRALWPTGL
ncbi:hypothetical protein [Streptomyces flaveus]